MSKEFFENNFLNMGENSPAVDDGSPLSLANSLSVEEGNQRTIPTHLVALEKAMMSLFFENTEEYQYPTANNLLDFIHHDASSKALLMNFTRSEIAQYTKYLVKQMASHPILKDSSIASDDSTLEKFGEDCFIQEEISSIKEEARAIPKLVGRIEKEIQRLFLATTHLEPTAENLLAFLTTTLRAMPSYKRLNQATVSALKGRLEKAINLSKAKAYFTSRPVTGENDPDLGMNAPTMTLEYCKMGQRVGHKEHEMVQLFINTIREKPSARNLLNFLTFDPRARFLYKNINPGTVSGFKERLEKALNLPKNEIVSLPRRPEAFEQNDSDLSMNAPTVVEYYKKGKNIGPKERGMIQEFIKSTGKFPSSQNLWKFFQEEESEIFYKNFHIDTVKGFKKRIDKELGLDVKKKKTLPSIVEGYRLEQPTLSLSELRAYCQNKIPQIANKLNRTKGSVTAHLIKLFQRAGKIGRQFPSELNLEGSASKKIKTIQQSLPPQASNPRIESQENILRHQATSIENPQMGNFDNQQIISGPLSLSDAYKNFAVFSQINPSEESKTTLIGDKQSSLKN